MPRAAASLILVRRGTNGPGVDSLGLDGLEVLMGMRGAGHRFMPNRLVFPGGAVEAEDAATPAASEPPETTIAHLLRHADRALARGLVVAAVRELEEETGLSFGVPPRLGTLHYLCRAVTPPMQPIRFDARFFVADAAGVEGVLGGSGELEGLRWYPVGEVLLLDLAMVTREVLGQLQAWLGASQGWLPEGRETRTETPVFRMRRWSME